MGVKEQNDSSPFWLVALPGSAIWWNLQSSSRGYSVAGLAPTTNLFFLCRVCSAGESCKCNVLGQQGNSFMEKDIGLFLAVGYTFAR
jgi:hypothetical protein